MAAGGNNRVKGSKKEIASTRAAAPLSRPIESPSQTGTVITVGCKLPHGIHMDFSQPGKALKRFTLNGSNSARIIGGFGITEDVPKDFFDAWMHQNREHPAVKNGLIFSMSNSREAAAYAKDHSTLKTGLEPVVPKDYAPRGKNQPGIESFGAE